MKDGGGNRFGGDDFGGHFVGWGKGDCARDFPEVPYGFDQCNRFEIVEVT